MINSKRFYIILALVLLVAAGLRLYKFDYVLPSGHNFHPSLYDDERKILDIAVSLDFSNGILGPKEFNYTGLGFYFYRLGLEVSDVLGITVSVDHIREKALTTDDLRRIYLVGRNMFFLVSMALIITIAITTRAVFGPWEGLCAAAFTAVLPSSVMIGRVIRFHGLACLFMTLVFYYAWKISKGNKQEDHYKAGIMLGLATASLYIAFPAAILMFGAVVIYNESGSVRGLIRAVFSKKLWKGYALSFATFLVFCLFFFINIYRDGFSWLGDIGRSTKEKFFVDPVTEGVGYFFYGLLPYAFGPFILILVGIGLYILYKNRSGRMMLLTAVTFILIALHLAFFSTRLLVRHTSWYMPYVCIFAAVAAVQAYKRGGKVMKTLIMILVSTAIGTNFYMSAKLVVWQSGTWPQITASNYLADKISPDETVATLDNFKELYPFILSPDNSLGDFRRKAAVFELQGDYGELEGSYANYFVAPEWELKGLRDKYLKRPDLYPEGYDFYHRLESGGLYRLDKEFENPAPRPLWLFGSRLVPRDFKLFGQKVLVYRKATTDTAE